MNMNDLSRELTEAGVTHEFVTSGDLRVSRKIAMAILKDRVGMRELKRIEAALRRDVNTGKYSAEKAHDAYVTLTSWFVREYAKKHSNVEGIDSKSVDDTANILVDDFERIHGELAEEEYVPTTASDDEVTAGDKRVARKIALAILKDRIGARELTRIEEHLSRDASDEEAYKAFDKLSQWFVREYAKKHPNVEGIDGTTIKDVTSVLVSDFRENFEETRVAAAGPINEADFYSSVIFGAGRAGVDSFISFLSALKPFGVFGIASFKQNSNGNFVARGRYIVLDIGATDPRVLMKTRGVVRVNYIAATTPAQKYEDRFDAILREFTDSFHKSDSKRVFAAVTEEDIELRDKAARSVQVRLKKAGFVFGKPSENKERVRLVIPGLVSKNIKKIKLALVGWKQTKAEGDELVFAKGDIRVSLRDKDSKTYIRIRHKGAKDWAGRAVKKTGDHLGIPPVYLGLQALPSVYGAKSSAMYYAVKFQGRRVYFYKPVGVTPKFLETLLKKSPVAVNKYVRSGKVKIVVDPYDTKTKKILVKKEKKTARKVA